MREMNRCEVCVCVCVCVEGGLKLFAPLIHILQLLDSRANGIWGILAQIHLGPKIEFLSRHDTLSHGCFLPLALGAVSGFF